MRLPAARQQKVFEEDWAPIEYSLQEKRLVGRIGEMTAFLRHYLAFRTGALPNENHVYARFRDYAERTCKNAEAFENEIKTLRRFAQHYNTLLRPQDEQRKDFREALIRFQSLDATSAYPFLLALFEARENGNITQSEWLEALAILENYMVRRYLSGEPVNFLNKMFASLWSELNTEDFGKSLQVALSRKKYPSSRRIEQNVMNGTFYGPAATRTKTAFVLSCINRHLSTGSGGYTALDGLATIEHIMPQNLSENWRDELGEQADTVKSEWLHTLGNLTLVTLEWNSSLSNAPFKVKKNRLSNHALRLNSLYFSRDISSWSEDAIRARADWILYHIEQLWPMFEHSNIETTGESATWRRPSLLHLNSETYNVASWRDVMRQSAEYLIVNSRFDAVTSQMKSVFRKEKFATRCHELSNGWWLMVNVSASDAISHCQRMIELAGLDVATFRVDEEIVPYKTS